MPDGGLLIPPPPHTHTHILTPPPPGCPPLRYDESGAKARYFADDDNVDLQTLVKRAKYGDDEVDMDSAVAGNITAKKK